MRSNEVFPAHGRDEGWGFADGVCPVGVGTCVEEEVDAARNVFFALGGARGAGGAVGLVERSLAAAGEEVDVGTGGKEEGDGGGVGADVGVGEGGYAEAVLDVDEGGEGRGREGGCYTCRIMMATIEAILPKWL